jgi:cytochrome c5
MQTRKANRFVRALVEIAAGLALFCIAAECAATRDANAVARRGAAKHPSVAPVRYVCPLIALLVATGAGAQNGAAVYKAQCASCHNSGAARVPSEGALRAMNLVRVLTALQSGVMKTVGNMLSCYSFLKREGWT